MAGGRGLEPRLVSALVAAWSLRLGLHLWRRTAGAAHEDARYAEFRVAWGEAFQPRMFAFLQAQALATALLTLAMLAAARNPAPFPAWSDVGGLALLALAVVAGEGRGCDAQLARFKADQAHQGGICETGLWAWSRHPNYFFEWLVWLAYALIAIGPDGRWTWGWVALVGPASMFVLLRFVSGVPPTEAAMAKSRGASLARYQARVSPFFPLPPRAPFPREIAWSLHRTCAAATRRSVRCARSLTPSPVWASDTWSVAPGASSTRQTPAKPFSCAT